jgi:sugar lactone lactonase YvrE
LTAETTAKAVVQYDLAEMPSDKQLTVSEPICVAATGDACGEGSLWHPGHQCLYWTDINRFLVHRYSPRDRSVRSWLFSEPVTCVLQTMRDDVLALVLGSGVILWEPATDLRGKRIFSLPGWPGVRCNDAAVDPRGRLWVGSMRNNVGADGSPNKADGFEGVLYSIDPTGNATQWLTGIGISNTLVWSPDESTFYFGDTPKNRICSYEYDPESGAIRGERVFSQDFGRGFPDGSAMDEEGYLWNCRFSGGCVVRFSPQGKVDRVIEIPAQSPTNCTFGGPDGNVLYVTSASIGSSSWQRWTGCLFALETNVRGVREHAFQFPVPATAL